VLDLDGRNGSIEPHHPIELAKIVAGCVILPLTFHHTCASWLFNKAKLNPKQVQHWLGHHSASFTIDTYIHLLEEDLTEAPDALDALVYGSTEGQPEVPKTAEVVSESEDVIPLNQAIAAV